VSQERFGRINVGKTKFSSNIQRVKPQKEDHIIYELELPALRKWRRYLHEAIGLSYVDYQKIRNRNYFCEKFDSKNTF
jgi:hypothetical protein